MLSIIGADPPVEWMRSAGRTRKSFDSLAALVREGLGGDPLSGDLFVFRNKAADRIKLLPWEEDGYSIWYKRLEVGTFRFPQSPEARPRVEIRAADLVMLLNGVDLASVKRGKRYHRPVARPPVEHHIGT